MQLSMASLDFGYLSDRRAKRAVSYRLRTLEDYDRPSVMHSDEVLRTVRETPNGSLWQGDQLAEVQ